MFQAAELVDWGENRKISFPNGFQIVVGSGNVIKPMPDAREAVARTYELRSGKNRYVCREYFNRESTIPP